MHGGAACEGEGGGRVKIQSSGQFDQRASGNNNLFGESTVARYAKQFATEAEGFLALLAELARAAEQIGLDGDAVAGLPIGDRTADGSDHTGHFAARRAREWDGNRQAGGFEPEIEVIQAAGADGDDDFVGRGAQLRQVAEFKCSGLTGGGELSGFHDSKNRIKVGAAEDFSNCRAIDIQSYLISLRRNCIWKQSMRGKFYDSFFLKKSGYA